MVMRHKFVALSALTLVSLFSVGAAQAQSLPQMETRAFRFELPASAYLGIQTENINSENFGRYGLNEVRGVGVTSVVESSPAAKAGLRERDVILRFDGEEIKSVTKLTRLLGETAPDHTVRIQIYRNGGEQEIAAKLGKRPNQNAMTFNNFPELEGDLMRRIPVPPPSVEGFEMRPAPDNDYLVLFNRGRKIGVTAVPLNKQLGDFFGTTDGKGLLVEEVRADSPAAKAGLKAGDVILEVDGQAVEQQGDLVRLVNKKSEGDVNLTILRDKQRQTIRVTPEGKTPQTTSGSPNTKFKI